MGDLSEIIESPLTREALAARYRELCADPHFDGLPGKIELDQWGRILMSPASNRHGVLQARLIQRLAGSGGQVLAEASVLTQAGVLVADVAWLSAARWTAFGHETPFPSAPDLCIEIASPSDSRKGLEDKVAACLDAGAVEVWIVFPRGNRIDVHGPGGQLASSRYPIDIDGFFD